MITDKEYLESRAYSQSKLKKILGNPRDYIDPREDSEFDEPKVNITIGDGIDILLTQNEDAFFEKFHIASVERPTGQMGDYVWSLFIHRNNEDAEEIAYQEAGFRRDTFEKVKERFKTEGRDYFNDLINGEDKTVITPAQFTQIQTAKETLLTHPFTAKYFKESDRFKVLYQVPIYFEFEGVSCKGLLDLVVIDTLEESMRPIDIKSTNYKVNNWVGNFWSLRYDFQAAFYKKGLELGGYKEKFGVKTIEDFRFIVVNQTAPENPLVFEAGPEIIDFGLYGGKMITKEYEGVVQAIQRVKWHEAHDLWDYKIEDYLNYGVRSITLPKI